MEWKKSPASMTRITSPSPSSTHRGLRKDEEAALDFVKEEVFGGDEALMARYQVLRTALYSHTRITLLTPAKNPEV